MPESVQWKKLTEPTVRSSGGVDYRILDDGSLTASGPNPLQEMIEIKTRIDQPITAVRLDTIPEERADGKTTAGRNGSVQLHDFSLELVSRKEQDSSARASVSFLISDYPFWIPVERAIDNRPSTTLGLGKLTEPHSLVFAVDCPPVETETELVIRISTGGNWIVQGRNFKRFRLSLTSDGLGIDDTHQAAESLLKLAVKNDLANYWSRLALAETLQKQRPPKLDEAMRHATVAVALRPDHEGGRIAVLRSIDKERLLSDDSLLAAAQTNINQLLASDDDHPAAKSFIDDLIQEANRLADQEESDRAREFYQLVLKLRPDDAKCHFRVAYQLGSKLNDDAAASKVNLKTIELNPAHKRAHNNLGICFSNLGETEKAAEMFRKEIELYPSAADAYNNLASNVADQGRISEAIQLCRKSIQIEPYESKRYSSLASIVVKSPQPHDREVVDQAIAVVRKGMDRLPGSAPLFSALGRLLFFRGSFVEAEESFRKATELDPTYSSYQHNLAAALTKQGKRAEALEVRKKEVSLIPDDATELNNLAWDLVIIEDPSLWDPKLAVELAEKALEIDSESFGLLNTLGIAYYRNGDWEKSIDTLTQSLESNPQISYDAFFLAMAHWQLGHETKAKEWFDKAVQWMEEKAPADAELIRFRKEAEKLMASGEAQE